MELLTPFEVEFLVPQITRKIIKNEKEIIDTFTYQNKQLSILSKALATEQVKTLDLVGGMEIDRLTCVHQFTSGSVFKDVNETIADMVLDKALRLCLSKYGNYFSSKCKGEIKN
jgi:hypothetical protein